MATAAPARKVVAASGGGGAGGALAEIAIFLIERWYDLPENVESAVRVLVIIAAAFAAGYLVPPSADDRPVPPDAGTP